MVSYTPRPLYPLGKSSGTHWIGGWVGPKTGLEAVTERKIPIPAENRIPVVQPLSWSLCWIRYPILVLLSQLQLGFPRSLPFEFYDRNFVCISHLSHACYIPWLILLGFITLMISDEEYKLRSSSLCSILQPPAASSILGPNILLSTLFSNTLHVVALVWEIKFHAHTKQQVKLLFFYFNLHVFGEGTGRQILNWMKASIQRN